MWKRLRSHGLVVAGALLLLLIVAVALWPATTEVDMASATRRPLLVTIDDEGETRVRERFVISAPVAGRLERIQLEPGDPVTRGETVVARLTPAAPPLLDTRTRAEFSAALAAARAAVGQARAERARAAAALERARSLMRRQEGLVAAGAISRDEFEVSQTSVKTAEEALNAAAFNVNRAEFDQQMAAARLQSSTAETTSRSIAINAPVNGVVLKRQRESEAIVQAGEPLLEVGDPSHLEVVADLLSTDAVRVMQGARVLIEQWGGGHTLIGRVRRIEPSGFMKVSALGVEEQRVNVVVDFADAGEARALGDSYRVEVRIVVWEQPDVLSVPVGALFRQGSSWAVFVVRQGRAQLLPVTVGQRNDADAQIADGLQAGDVVVLHPPDNLRASGRVSARSGN